MTLPPVIRPRDIGGARFPKGAEQLPQGQAQAVAVPVSRPPEIEPPPGATEFIKTWSILAPGAATSQLFTLDANFNVISGAAVRLPDNNRARISGILFQGESPIGNPVLFFSIRTNPGGTERWQPFDSIGLPAQGGFSSIGFEPFTVIPAGFFFGVFVQNTDGAAHFASVTMQGWLF